MCDSFLMCKTFVLTIPYSVAIWYMLLFACIYRIAGNLRKGLFSKNFENVQKYFVEIPSYITIP